MFVRLYAGIFAAFLLSLLLSYGYYDKSREQRLAAFQEQQLQGLIRLISDNAQRQQAETKKQQYLDLAAKLLGAELQLNIALPTLSALQTSTLQRGLPVNLTSDRKAIEWLFAVSDNHHASLTFSEINEQSYRGTASLLVAELARLAWPQTLDALSPYRTIPTSLTTLQNPALDAQQRQRLNRGSIVIDYDESQSLQLKIYAPANDKVLVVGPIERFNPLPWSTLLSIILLIVGLVSATTVLMVFLLQRRFNRVIETVERYGTGDLDVRVNMQGQDILAQLATRFDAMASQIQTLLDNQQHLLQAVSHELRTPLAKMKFRLQLLEDDKNTSAKTVGSLRSDINQLELLVNEVMTFQRLANPNPSFISLDLAPLLKDEIASFEELHHHIKISEHLATGCRTVGNANAIKRLFSNLLSNACKHCNGEVLISMEIQAERIKVCFEDNGAGIPDTEKPKVFDAFYRVDASRNKNTGGYGLGLAIVQRICDTHKAQLSLSDSTELGGACFTVSFEAAK